MKINIYKILFFTVMITMMVSCEVEEFSDLNGPEVSAFGDEITRGDLQDLIGGILYSSRLRLGTYYDDCGVIGREYWRFSGSDPRFTTDLLGGGNSVLDNNTFYITGPWAARYRTVKNANLILGFFDTQDLSAQFSTSEIDATIGLLRTFIAYELLLNLNLTNDGGIRLDVADENNLGPFVSKSVALTGIRAILDAGAGNLGNGGGAFPFVLTSGFSGFDTPSSFLKANRAISARVAAYQGDASSVLNYLNSSFFSLNGSDLNTGIYYNFSEDQTDIINPLFISIGGTSAAQARIVQPLFITDAEGGDNRLDKVAQLSEPVTLDGLTGDYIVNRYLSNSDDIPIIRNEELILLYAEANITKNSAEAVIALNIIRNSAGLGDYSGATDTESLINEMLNQRRYSLYAEGHRWIDMRRYNKLDELPIDRPPNPEVPDDGDNVWIQFPIPLTENQ